MDFKYSISEQVVSKRDFQLLLPDHTGELNRVVSVPKDCEGTVVSANGNHLVVSYEVLFQKGGVKVSAPLTEEEMDDYVVKKTEAGGE